MDARPSTVNADAKVQAAMQIDRLFEAGGLDGAALWCRTVALTVELQRTALEGRVR